MENVWRWAFLCSKQLWLIFNLLASSKGIIFPLILLNFVITRTVFSWFIPDVPTSLWPPSRRDEVTIIWKLCSWEEVQAGTCSTSPEDRGGLQLVHLNCKVQPCRGSRKEWHVLAAASPPAVSRFQFWDHTALPLSAWYLIISLVSCDSCVVNAGKWTFSVLWWFLLLGIALLSGWL